MPKLVENPLRCCINFSPSCNLNEFYIKNVFTTSQQMQGMVWKSEHTIFSIKHTVQNLTFHLFLSYTQRSHDGILSPLGRGGGSLKKGMVLLVHNKQENRDFDIARRIVKYIYDGRNFYGKVPLTQFLRLRFFYIYIFFLTPHPSRITFYPGTSRVINFRL